LRNRKKERERGRETEGKRDRTTFILLAENEIWESAITQTYQFTMILILSLIKIKANP
jgi:hypothetical protein